MTFRPVPRLPTCPTCASNSVPRSLSNIVDAAYCISVAEETFRTKGAAEHFHERGLCRDVQFYQPPRGKVMFYACWQSHRDVARQALREGHHRILVFEDDVKLPKAWGAALRRIAAAMAKLPPDWWGFFLGHRPLDAVFARGDILRTRSMYAHAYIANEPLIRWLATSEPVDPRIPMAHEHGYAVDTAMANLPSMYALFPMIATQRHMGATRVDASRDERGVKRGLLDPGRYQYFGRLYGMRLFEYLSVLKPPYRRCALERLRLESGAAFADEARICATMFDEDWYKAAYPGVEAAGWGGLFHYMVAGYKRGHRPHPLFDPAFYEARYPDVAQSGLNPLTHFLRFGVAQGRSPHVLFDAEWYATTYAETLGERLDLFGHFRSEGEARGLDPNTLFDTAWYAKTYPDAGASPLTHYISIGWKANHLPSRRFDGQRYLRMYPDVAKAGMEPLEHYLKRGKAEGRECPTAG